MKPKLYKSLLYSMVGAGMLSLGSCAGIFLLAQFLLGMVRVR